MDFSTVRWEEIGKASIETLQILGASGLFTIIIGLPLGVLLFMTARSASIKSQVVYTILSFIVNILRSVPFIILIVALIPFTRSLVGTATGVLGVIPPLVIAAAPYFARLVETTLREVDRGVIEAAQAMGASTGQIVRRVLLPEALPGLLAGITITIVTLVSYTAMAGMVGGGGLGTLAINYGYYRYQNEIMIIAVVFMVILVQVLQMAGDRLVKWFTRK
ncbi:methionine ABC transporter permease [Paenibacillus sp. UMB7766-LJ446]|jgi:D-methionine transport system permease protein|uniref:ABC transporter permease n=1 Tax=Paenibacillus vandeheii TaxID=3035917 RepID=A0ABT8JIJ1_9BACL|nr:MULTISPECIES: methionine ABC transporter permease [Paenibacillus]OPG97782.1 metal ABC transporter permease [Chryseobacterium mucoviscidosis]KGP81484.1 metal ABC transporter permease [Paenibacillus sp. MAEPY1]KGP81492.1 metal ABC transporter permease [Paenibacillus sp. MAEPY2]MDK8192168.1 methionine ABC transporter permease [Paenibacillus sp. UMB7766-LJ446]MDN4604648.1 ABC transporter permease [Paenibacillus vandeheii]